MAKTDERVELIGSAILSQANQEARELIDKANKLHEAEIAQFEETVVDGMFGKIQAKATQMRLESIKSAARSQLEAHRALLLHRNEKTGAVFEIVKSRLIDYAETAEYKSEMLKRAETHREGYDHSESVIFARENDMELAGEINVRLGGKAKAKADAGIKIGGFKISNSKAGVLIDETLDERLAEQKPWFLQNCGLKIM